MKHLFQFTEWDDVYEVAKALTKDTDGDGKVDIYGFAAAGLSPNELAHAWLNPFRVWWPIHS